MRYRVTFVAGLAIGYVLGARAGRDRYEQIAGAARRLRESPAFTRAAETIQEQAGDLAGAARQRATHRLRSVRRGGSGNDELSYDRLNGSAPS